MFISKDDNQATKCEVSNNFCGNTFPFKQLISLKYDIDFRKELLFHFPLSQGFNLLTYKFFAKFSKVRRMNCKSFRIE